MCVLSIKMPTRKKSENLFNDPRMFLSTFFPQLFLKNWSLSIRFSLVSYLRYHFFCGCEGLTYLQGIQSVYSKSCWQVYFNDHYQKSRLKKKKKKRDSVFWLDFMVHQTLEFI